MRERNLPMQWYTRRGGVVRGPFNGDDITRHFILGRIRLDDELSQDRVAWRPANDCAALLPAEMQQLSSWEDYQQLVIARMQVDERKAERRRQPDSLRYCSNRERRKAKDRRSRDSDRLVSQYLFGQVYSSAGRSPEKNNVRSWLLTVLLVTMVLAWLAPIRL